MEYTHEHFFPKMMVIGKLFGPLYHVVASMVINKK